MSQLANVDKIILVTGGTGTVGRALQKIINEKCPQNEKWVFVGSKIANLCKTDETDNLIENTKPTHVIHLAAMVGGLFHNMSNNLDFFRRNMQINDNVLNCCFKSNHVEKVISCLSTCIFPDKTSYPIDETMIHNGPPHPSNYGYSYAKRMIDVLNRGFSEKSNKIFTSIIPCNVFGPDDNFDDGTSHVIPALIRRLHATISNGGNTFTVYGSGKPLRQFIYSLDLAKLIIFVLDHYDDVEPIILAVNESDEISIGDAAKSIAKSFNFNGEIIFDTTFADGQFKKTASNNKLRKILPNFQFTPFDEAIQETVQWYKNNSDIRNVINKIEML